MPLNALFLALALWLALVPGAARAANACTVGSTPLLFGLYDGINGAPLQINATITVSCSTTTFPTPTIPYSVSMGPSGTTGTMARQMAGPGSARLTYNLFIDEARTTVWGDGSAGTMKVVDSIKPALVVVPGAKIYSVFGKIPLGQNVAAGGYGDSLMITVDY